MMCGAQLQRGVELSILSALARERQNANKGRDNTSRSRIQDQDKLKNVFGRRIVEM